MQPVPIPGAATRRRLLPIDAFSMRRLAAIGAAACLAGCAAYGPYALATGDSVDATTARLGAPTARYALPDGHARLEFARGPLGRHTYMVDFDAQGRMTGWQQVLDDAHFAAIQPGTPIDDVLARIGHPSDVWAVRYHAQSVWTYRYANNDCLVFNLGITPGGRVDGPDPRCERREKD